MGQVIFIGFFAMAAISLAVLGYFTGRYDALTERDEQEEEDEQEEIKKKREADFIDNLCRSYRKHKRIDYDLRREWAGVRKA